MRRPLLLAAAAMVLAAPTALGHGRDSATLNCPSTAYETRARAIHERIDALQARLDVLDSRLEDFNAVRRDALDEAKARIEQAARDPALGRDQLDREVANALRQADLRARSAARSASQAHAQMSTVKGQMQSLEQQLHALAARDGAAGAAS